MSEQTPAQPVEIVAPTPVPVEIVAGHHGTSLPPATTYQEDLTTSGQRRINLIWESTQAIIAVLVIVANMVVASLQGLGVTPPREYPIILSSSLFLIVGFYFSRTNHAAIGGVGRKPNEEYKGR